MRLRTTQEGYYRDRIIALAPVSYWMMREHVGNVAQDEMGINPGAYQNSPSLAQAGGLQAAPRDVSVSFNGSNQNIIVPHSPSLAITGDMTVEMMLYPRSFANYAERLFIKQAYLSGDVYPGSYHVIFWGGVNGSGLALVFGNGSSQTVTQSNVGMTANAWHLCHVTQKGTLSTYWFDGKQVGQFSNYQSRIDTGGSVQIMGQGTRYPHAKAAHVAVYNRALGEDEIIKNYRIFAGLDKPRKFYVVSKFSPAMRWWLGA